MRKTVYVISLIFLIVSQVFIQRKDSHLENGRVTLSVLLKDLDRKYIIKTSQKTHNGWKYVTSDSITVIYDKKKDNVIVYCKKREFMNALGKNCTVYGNFVLFEKNKNMALFSDSVCVYPDFIEKNAKPCTGNKLLKMIF